MKGVDGVDHELEKPVSELVARRLRWGATTSGSSAGTSSSGRGHSTSGRAAAPHTRLAGGGCVPVLKHNRGHDKYGVEDMTYSKTIIADLTSFKS